MRVDVEIRLGLEMPDEAAVGAAVATLYHMLTDSAADALVGEPAADLSWTLRRLLSRLPDVEEVLEHHVTVGYAGGETNVSGGRRPPRPGRPGPAPEGPNPPDEGGSGVREPRRPRPKPPGSLAADLPTEAATEAAH